jgi:hypothetical protein
MIQILDKYGNTSTDDGRVIIVDKFGQVKKLGGGGGTVTTVTATSPITSTGGPTPNISTLISANKLIGRTSAGTGVMEEITLGTGLSFSGSTLNSNSATTSNVISDVVAGAINVGDTVNANTNLQEFVEKLLYKTYYPTLISPTFSLSNNAGTREIGSSSAITLTFNFNRGDILGKTVSGIWEPATTQGYRAGASTSYTINGTTQVGNTLSVSPTLLSGGNTFNGTVTYATGIQPIDSKGNNYNSPLPGSTSASQSTTIQGIYPYFWYKSSSPITDVIMQSAIASGAATKVVGISTGTITITFGATGEYLAFAYPDTSTTKTVWFVTSLNSGTIPGGVFGSATILSCSTSLWSGINYKIHVTAGLITESGAMQLRNS